LSQIAQTPYGLQARNYTIKADLFNTTSINLNTNILSTNIFTDIWPAAEWTLYICPVGSGTLTLRRTQTSSGTTVSELLNSGAALVANAAYVFSFFVSKGEEINFQYSVSSVITKMTVQETLSPS